jgi:cell division protein FtsB
MRTFGLVFISLPLLSLQRYANSNSVTYQQKGIPKLKIGPMNITLHKEIEVLKSKVEQLEMQVKQLQVIKGKEVS